MLLTIPFDEKNLEEMSQKVVTSCISCHSEFGNICDGDPMINIKVPKKVGIGVTRGSTCCLVSKDLVIDYSGRLLNLAARLTDIARPSGIVIDGAFIIGLLTEEQRNVFKEERVYLKGIAENKSISVFYMPEFTVIPQYNKQPIVSPVVKQEKFTLPFKDLLKMKEHGVGCKLHIENKSVNLDSIEVRVKHQAVHKGRIEKGYTHSFYINYFDFYYEGESPVVSIKVVKLCEKLEKDEVRKGMAINFFVEYTEK